MKTGWIYDNGNWYYCWSNGQMAKDTTVDGYCLNSNGAWTNQSNHEDYLNKHNKGGGIAGNDPETARGMAEMNR